MDTADAILGIRKSASDFHQGETGGWAVGTVGLPAQQTRWFSRSISTHRFFVSLLDTDPPPYAYSIFHDASSPVITDHECVVSRFVEQTV